MIKYRTRNIDSYVNNEYGYSLISNRRTSVELPPGIIPEPFVFNMRSTQLVDNSLYLTFRPPVDDSTWSVRDDDNNIELANSDGYLHESVTWWEGSNGYSELTITCNNTLRTYSVHGAIDLLNPSAWPNYDYNYDTGEYSTEIEFNVLSWSNIIRRYEFRLEATKLIVPETIPPHITSFCQMFFGCSNFNQDISMWDVSKVVDFSYMFLDCYMFNSPLNTWNMASAITIEQILCNCYTFNQPIGNWNTTTIEHMSAALASCMVFDQDISTWDVSNVKYMNGLFNGCNEFNQNITGWDVSNVVNMNSMLRRCFVFNQPIGTWDVSNVTNMASLFVGTKAFNQDLSTWDTSKVTTMSSMFNTAEAFNKPLNSWNVSNVTNMSGMFNTAGAYNLPLNLWNTISVTNMSFMFKTNGVFNQDISMWNVGNVTNMNEMFAGNTIFNQNLSSWCMTGILSYPSYFAHEQYPATNNPQWILPKPVWGTCPRGEVPVVVPGYDDRIEFTITSATDHTTSDGVQIISDGSWKKYEIYRNDVLIASDTLTSSDISRAAYNVGNIFTINHNLSGTVNYKIYSQNRQKIGFAQRNDGATQTVDLTLDVIHLPTFPIGNLTFNTHKLNLIVSAGLPKSITRCDNMFLYCTKFNSSLAHWDTSHVISMSTMFNLCTNFNQDISMWDTSNVDNFSFMFQNCIYFNQPLAKWNISNSRYMYGMFAGCEAFNQDLSSWCMLSSNFEQDSFSLGTTAWTLPKPVWGTCLVNTGFRFSFKPDEEYPQTLTISAKGGPTSWQLLDGLSGELLADSTGYTIISSTVINNPYYEEFTINIVHDVNDLRTYELICSKKNVTLTYKSVSDIKHIGKASPEAVITVLNYSKNITSYSFNAGFATLVIPTSLPDYITSAEKMFSGSYLFNQNISLWDTSRLTSTDRMFWDCASFNVNISNWDVSKVTDMDNMFSRCIKFNQNLSSWNVGAVTTMDNMFYGCISFNQDLSSWIVKNMLREPWDFDGGAIAWTLPKPIWGTNGGV